MTDLNLNEKPYCSIRSLLNVQTSTGVIGRIDMHDTDSISHAPYLGLIREKDGKEPFVIAITQRTVDQKPFFRRYSGEVLSAWLEGCST